MDAGKTAGKGKSDARKDGLGQRIKAACELANASDSPAIVWCVGNEESKRLAEGIEGAVELRGEYDFERKEAIITAFADGTPFVGCPSVPIKVLVAKTSMCGLGVNLQRASRQIFATATDNGTTFYQSVRRSYRFGQTQNVTIVVVRSEAEGNILQKLRDQQDDADGAWEGVVSVSKDAWAPRH